MKCTREVKSKHVCIETRGPAVQNTLYTSHAVANDINTSFLFKIFELFSQKNKEIDSVTHVCMGV